MDHRRLGNLPRTHAWKEVEGLISDAADVVNVADTTLLELEI